MIIKQFLNPLKLLLLLYLMMLAKKSYSQDSLKAYIRYGLENNLTLLNKNTDLEKAGYALSIAKSYFLPSVNFNGLVSHAQGGRYADLPLGDMLNPVYSTLNQLTSSGSFPQIDNQSIQFLPQKYYDVYIRTSMPLYNPMLKINQSLVQSQIQIKELQLDVYKRELVLQIKSAYYNIQSAHSGIQIYQQALVLLEKNLQVNQSLYNNGKALPAQVLRAKSELDKIKAQLKQAQTDFIQARSYFNFLINKPLQSDVHLLNQSETEQLLKNTSDSGNIQNREELKLLNVNGEVQQSLLKMSQSQLLPSIQAFADIGAQAVDFEVSKKAPYYMVGISVSVPIYTGSKNKTVIKQSQLDCRINDNEIENTKNALQLSQSIVWQKLVACQDKLTAEISALKSAEAYYQIIERGYLEGINSQIEYVDARSQLTESQMRKNLALFELLKTQAELERENASYTF